MKTISTPRHENLTEVAADSRSYAGVRVFFRVLGPLHVTIDDTVVRLAKNRQLTVLALLLTEVNKIVSVGRIVDAVWGDSPPATADKQIQTCVWRLRSTFEKAGAPAGLIETAQGGYLLRLPAGCLDTQVFEQRVLRGRSRAEDGDLAGAVEDYRHAVALFRGTPMAELDSPTIVAVSAYWAERRLAVLEECLDIELAMGRHRELVSELRLLVDEHPLREQLRGRLMTALYLSDRRADALAVYRAGRATLVKSLGLDPCARLQDLHRRIIAGHPVNSPQPQRSRHAVKVPVELPADVGEFTGRADELERLEQELTRDQAGRPRIVSLVGAAGTGKTALAVHAAHRLRDRFADGQLYADLRGCSDPVAPYEVLGSFLYSLGVPERNVPDDLAGRAGLFRSIVAGRRLLILLDDAARGAQIEPLLPGRGDSALLCTSQSSMIETPGVTIHRLAALDRTDAVDLLGRLAGPERVAREPEPAARIVELCGRLPLAIRAAGARLQARPSYLMDRFVERLADEHRRLAELSYGSLDTAGRLVAAADRLPAGARRLLLVLSSVDLPRISAWAAAALLEISEDEAQDLLDQLVDQQLIDVTGAEDLGGARYEQHPLVRLCARQLARAEIGPEYQTAAMDRLVKVLSWLAAHAGDVLDPRSATLRPAPEAVTRIGRALLRDVTEHAARWLDQERETLTLLHRAADPIAG